VIEVVERVVIGEAYVFKLEDGRIVIGFVLCEKEGIFSKREYVEVAPLKDCDDRVKVYADDVKDCKKIDLKR
jgi:hypothetical protein